MTRFRRTYYDKFSRVYDRFIAMHSRDKQGLARKFLAAQVPVESGASVLDLCTGTGTLIQELQSKVEPNGQVVGVDFSRGMLSAAKRKVQNFANVYLVEADAGCLPFAAGMFDAVTCSHAFYELKGDTQDLALREVLRVLKPGGSFLMMEHDVPSNWLVRALFYFRLSFIGGGRARTFLRREREILQSCFAVVTKIQAPAGRSKILVCRKQSGKVMLAAQASATGMPTAG